MRQQHRLLPALIAVLGVVASAPMSSAHAEPGTERTGLQELREEIAIAAILEHLGKSAPARNLLVENVRIVDPVDRTVRERQSIFSSLGTIVWTGDTGTESNVGDAVRIDGGGRFAAPGLTDMHVHTESASSWLLNLACGITTVREMGGFPWMLSARDAVNADRLVGPTMYVAGTIINYDELGGYAVCPRDVLSARRIVRQQAACGYDFIKVHNIVPRRIFDAVADEARRAGMDLVGHVPHGIPVRHAAEHGMRTMEHLKGFLNDATLQMGDKDYASVAGVDVWITPTLDAGRVYLPADQVSTMMNSPEMRYVPARVRNRWGTEIAHPDAHLTPMQQNAQVLMRQIVKSLVDVKAKFLVGTDAANYGLQVMGFAAIDEMAMMADAGVPAEDVLRAATAAPAEAMRAERDFGRIQPGMRTDFVLLDTNPLQDLATYRRNQGVMAHGRWLERAAIDSALVQLAGLYAHSEAPPRLSRDSATALATEARVVATRGFVFNARILRDAAAILQDEGFTPAADALEAMAATNEGGACAEIVR